MSERLWNLDLGPIYLDELIPVGPGHLVVEAQGVHRLVLYHHLLPTVVAGQLHCVCSLARAPETYLGPDWSTQS